MSNPNISVRNSTDYLLPVNNINFGYIAADQVGFPCSITIFNNYESLFVVGDAYDFTVCSYDNQDKTSELDAVKEAWLQVRQVSYNDTPVNSDWVSIGGDKKFILPYNGGVINGSDGVRGAKTVVEFRVATPHRVDIAKKWTPYICFEYSTQGSIIR
jgi:hypothetical protein